MGAFKLAFFAALGAVIYVQLEKILFPPHPLHLEGTVEPGYERLKVAFEQNFHDGWEIQGGTFAVWVKGKQVANLWGGYADYESARKWSKDTLQVTFSTTKGVAAVCVALLADRGRLKYDDLVVKHWPGFHKFGKDNLTIQHALSHMAGLSYVDAVITEEHARDHNLMKKLLEDEPPKWPPGTATGYHSITYGWIVDQIIRHTDEKKRGIGQFLREEITGPNKIDFHIGLPKTEAWRVAKIHISTILELLPEVTHDWRVLFRIVLKNLGRLLNTVFHRTVSNPSWLSLQNPEYYDIEQAGALGIGNANSLGSIFNLFVTEKLVSKETLNQLQNYHIKDVDLTIPVELIKGHGFFYFPLNRAGVKHMVGHAGYGCQYVAYDLRNQIVIAYTTNALKAGEYTLCRTYTRLQNALYDIVETQWIPK